jgi:hypothetical protein
MNNLLYSKVADVAIVRNCEVVFYSCEAYIGVRVPDYKSRGLGSIPGATRFSEK